MFIVQSLDSDKVYGGQTVHQLEGLLRVEQGGREVARMVARGQGQQITAAPPFNNLNGAHTRKE